MDLTVAAVPFYFASMGAEAWWQARTRGDRPPTAGDYERNDTLASLSMGVGSLLVPLVSRPLIRKFDVASGRYAKTALTVTAGALATTVVADAVARRGDLEAGRVPLPAGDPDGNGNSNDNGNGSDDDDDLDARDPSAPPPARRTRRARIAAAARRVGSGGALTTIASAGLVVAGTWTNRTLAKRLWERRVLPDWGSGPAAALAAIAGWDFVYYWNHRLQHEVRYLWAIHVVHHSSRHYNLSTALRQPVADALGTFLPYGVMAWLGIRPSLIEQARGVNLIYQFWIHTEVIRSLGPFEAVLNSPSHHRVHHGANRQYLDRNHGSILIVWDRLFGTFEPEDEDVVYGLTKNIGTFNPARIAAHEYADIGRDVVRSSTWRDRLGFVLRGPGWATQRRRTLTAAGAPGGYGAGDGDPGPPRRRHGRRLAS